MDPETIARLFLGGLTVLLGLGACVCIGLLLVEGYRDLRDDDDPE